MDRYGGEWFSPKRRGKGVRWDQWHKDGHLNKIPQQQVYTKSPNYAEVSVPKILSRTRPSSIAF
jgi:hypothetical protein